MRHFFFSQENGLAFKIFAISSKPSFYIVEVEKLDDVVVSTSPSK